LLIVDDTTLTKPYARAIELVHRHWSGKAHRVVAGINLVTLVWSDGTDTIPCDYRLYDKPVDGLIKNCPFSGDAGDRCCARVRPALHLFRQLVQ
jgi:hypothetical protein